MQRLGQILITVLLSTFALQGVAADDHMKYQNTLQLFRTSAVTDPYFEHAYGYAVFPTVGKGGFILGGAYGKGKVYRSGEMAGITTVKQLSLGLQVGAQAFSEIIFFQDKRAYMEFVNGAFEFDTTASAVAVTAGAQASTGTLGASAGVSAGPKSDKQLAAAYYKGLAVFTHTKGGLMLEMSLAGQKFNFEPNQIRVSAVQ